MYSKIKTIEAENAHIPPKGACEVCTLVNNTCKEIYCSAKEKSCCIGLAMHQILCCCQNDILTVGSEVQDN